MGAVFVLGTLFAIFAAFPLLAAFFGLLSATLEIMF